MLPGASERNQRHTFLHVSFSDSFGLASVRPPHRVCRVRRFPLILNAWNEKHWIKPELLEQPELMQVKLTLHIQNDVSYSSSNDPINDPINLSERQKMILRMFSEEKNLSRERLCEKTGLSDATAKREIAFLKKTGYLERVGSLKTGHWIVVSK